MPTMPRPENKGLKIAFKILGKPANLATKYTKKQKKINSRLLFDETIRVR